MSTTIGNDLLQAVNRGDVEGARTVGEEMVWEILPDSSDEFLAACGEHFADEARLVVRIAKAYEFIGRMCSGEADRVEALAFCVEGNRIEADTLDRERDRAQRYGIPKIFSGKGAAQYVDGEWIFGEG